MQLSDRQDVRHAGKIVLGRALDRGAELDRALEETPADLFDRLYRSDEFRTAVAGHAIRFGTLPPDRFRGAPDLDALDWLARSVSLEPATRILVLHASSWAELHRALAADGRLSAGLQNGWSPEAFGRALADAGRANRGVRQGFGEDLGEDNGVRVDEAALHRLSALPAEHISVLFDLRHIERRSGRTFASPDDVVAAYFAEAPSARFSTTPLFDAAHYTAAPGWPGGDKVDPFAHFIAFARSDGADPHRLVSLSTVGGTGEGSVLERLCDLILGEVDGAIHPLLDLAYIRSQPAGAELSLRQILALADDPAAPLPFSPHPLFCVEEYRKRNTPGDRNELQHYLRLGQGALRTHPLVSPAYVHAQRPDIQATVRRSFLEAYLQSWPDAPVDPSLFVDIKRLGETMSAQDADARPEPLSQVLAEDFCEASELHAHLDGRMLAFAFGDASADLSPAALLRAALDLPVHARSAAGRPLVSVVMATYRKPVYTALSVLAASRALAAIAHEIIVVENGGELVHHEELLRIFAPYPNVRLIKLEANRYFGEASNIGIDMAAGDHVLFLNNDCFLAPDFGEQLVGLLESGERRFDALGATLLFPNGDIQEFGGSVGDDGWVIQRAKHLPPSFLRSLPELERVDYASATCLCLSRAALEAVGGFDPVFEPFYFEDTDLCRRLAKAGLDVFVSSRLRAMHIENGSTREFLGAGFDAQVARNRETYARRWLKQKGEDAYVRSEVRVRPAGSERPRALVYTPFDITPGGGERYLLSAARKLSETHEVVIATSRRMSRARVEFTRHALGVAPFPFRLGPAEEVVGRDAPFDVAFVMGNEIIPPLAPMARSNLFHLQFPFPWRHVGQLQFDRLQGYDAILVNSPYTAHWTRERLREAGVIAAPAVEVVTPPVQPLPRASRLARKADAPLRLVNVGRFFTGGHCKRQDVVLEVVAALRTQGVDVEATLIGSVPTTPGAQTYYDRLVADARRLGGVEILRDAGRRELAEALARSDIYLHACGFQVDVSLEPEAAEHYGIALVEALQAGCYPVVVDAGGPAEIVRAMDYGALYTTVPQAVEAIRAALAEGRLDAAASHAPAPVTEVAFDRWFDDWGRSRAAPIMSVVCANPF